MVAVLTDPLLVAGFGHNHPHGGVAAVMVAVMVAGFGHNHRHGGVVLGVAMAVALAVWEVAVTAVWEAVALAVALAVDGGNHSLLHGAEVFAEGRAKDGHRHGAVWVYRPIPAAGDGRQDECRDRHIPSRQCLGIMGR